jgi:acetyl-CoA acyltransferase
MTGAAVVGLGMTKFGKFVDRPLHDLAGEAIDRALEDGGLSRDEIDMAFVANAMASVTTGQVSVVGQAVLRPNGFSGIPTFNVDNACAGSSSALTLAVHAVAAGAARAVLVIGVEKLYTAERGASYRALNGAVDVPYLESAGIDPSRQSVFVASVYPERLGRYRARWGLRADTLARISVKNRANAAHNPVAQYTAPLSVADVLESRMIVDPVTALMCAPIGDGAAAVIVTDRRRAESAHARPVWIRGTAIGMGGAGSTVTGSTVWAAARKAYGQAGIEPGDIDVAEVHDSISFNELLAYEELGLCAPGSGHRLVEDGTTSAGGAVPVNPSGGLESRGHPVAATGLAQVVELGLQLRGEAGDRQVADARIAVAENAGGFVVDDTAAVAVTVLGSARS